MDAKTMIVLIIVAILVFIILAAAIIMNFFNRTIDTAANSTKPNKPVQGGGRRVRFSDLKKFTAGADDVSKSGAITTTIPRDPDNPLPVDMSYDDQGNPKQCSRPKCSACENTQKEKAASTDKFREFMKDLTAKDDTSGSGQINKKLSGKGIIINRDKFEHIIYKNNLDVNDILKEKNDDKIKINGYLSQQLIGVLSAHIKGYVEGKLYDDYKQIICNGLVNATIDGWFIPFSEMFDKEGNLKNKIVVIKNDEKEYGLGNYIVEKDDTYKDRREIVADDMVYNEKDKFFYNENVTYNQPEFMNSDNLNHQALQILETKYTFDNDEDINKNYLDISGLSNQYRKDNTIIYNRDDSNYALDLNQQNYLMNNKFNSRSAGAIF